MVYLVGKLERDNKKLEGDRGRFQFFWYSSVGENDKRAGGQGERKFGRGQHKGQVNEDHGTHKRREKGKGIEGKETNTRRKNKKNERKIHRERKEGYNGKKENCFWNSKRVPYHVQRSNQHTHTAHTHLLTANIVCANVLA